MCWPVAETDKAEKNRSTFISRELTSNKMSMNVRNISLSVQQNIGKQLLLQTLERQKGVGKSIAIPNELTTK